MEMETFRTKSYTASFASDQSNHNEGFGTAPLCYRFHAATNLQQIVTNRSLDLFHINVHLGIFIWKMMTNEWGSYNNAGYRYR